MNIEEKIKSLKIELPAPPKPKGTYVPAVKTGSLIFISGMLPLEGGEIKIKGTLGRELSLSDGKKAARIAVLNAISAIKSEIGSLDKVKRIVRLNGFIKCESGFSEQAGVLNGASELIAEIFGEKGLHSRTAAGVSDLPLGSPVEIDIIAEVES